MNKSKYKKSGFSVFVCEDDPQLRSILNDQLVLLGFRPTFSEDAKSALSELGTSFCGYDAAIFDLQLPDLNGDKVISWLRQSEISSIKNLPIMVLTGFPGLLPTDRDEVLGNCRVVQKPCSLADLEQNLCALIKGQPAFLNQPYSTRSGCK